MQAYSNTAIVQLGQQWVQVIRRIFYTPQYATRLAFWVNVVLIMMLAYIAARMTWQFVTPGSQKMQAVSVSTPSVTSQQKASLSNVSALHLFGVSDSTPVAQGPIEAPDTRLRLVLHGVFASTDPAVSMAIISEQSGKDKSYSKGDSLPGGAKLHEIYADRVILSRSGKLETLRLIRKSAEIQTQQPTRNIAPASSRSSSRQIRRAPKLKKIQETFKENPQEVFKQIRITPIMENGQINGYRFSHNDPTILKQMGLLPTDVITAVNGVSVQDSGSLLSMMNDVGQMTQISLSVLRNGNPQELSINIE